jgi:hypothetical protein
MCEAASDPDQVVVLAEGRIVPPGGHEVARPRQRS